MFLTSLHKNLLRLPSLAVAVSVAHQSRGTTVGELGDRYLKILQQPVAVDAERQERILPYIRDRSLIRKYTNRGGTPTMESLREVAERGKLSVDLQDWLLSDPSLRSSSGSERAASIARTISVCGELDLLRIPPGTVQTHGRILVTVAEREGLLPVRSDGANTFAPTPPYLATAYFNVLKTDDTFLIALLEFLEDGRPKGFSSDLAREAAAILMRVETLSARTAANRPSFEWLTKQQKFAEQLRSSIQGRSANGSAIQSKFRPVEDMLLPRLEFFVDMRILEKPTPHEFVYQLSSEGSRFRDRIRAASWDIDRDYFGAVADLLGVSSVAVHDDQILDHLAPAFGELRNAAGYAPIEEAVVLANAIGWSEHDGRTVEIAVAREALAERARTKEDVRIVSDRHRRPGAFKITD